MPVLLPPLADGPILGDIVNDIGGGGLLQETGRQNVLDFQDATKVVSTLSLVLGIVFLITTASLYAYYYSTTFDLTRRKRSLLQNKNNLETFDDADSTNTFLQILESLETAFLRWGVLETECKKKLICDSFLPDTKLKPEAKNLFELLSKFISEPKYSNSLSDEKLQSEEKTLFLDYIMASEHGMKEKSCKSFSNYCTFPSHLFIDQEIDSHLTLKE